MLVMVAVLVTGSLAVAYFGSRDNSIAISSNVEASSKARALAESGLDLAIAILETNADWRTEHLDGIILDSFAFGGGEITLTVIDAETQLPPTESTNEVEITIYSSVSGISQAAEAHATIIPTDEEFDVDYSEFALFTQSQLTIRDVASVKHWSASPLGTQDDPIQIGTLATSPMSVQINSWGQTSNIELHTLSNASSMISSYMSSDNVLPESPPFPMPPSPPENTSPLEFEEESFNSSNSSHWAYNFTGGFGSYFRNHVDTLNLYEGSYEVEQFQLGSNQPVVIHGDVTLTVNSDFNLNAASIELSENATLTIHVGGDVDIRSSYIGNESHSANSWSNPNRVRLFGHSDTDWDLRGITTIKGEIYAPNSDVELSGLTTLCGRIASDEITLRGASRLLYDPTLDQGGYADTSSALYNNDGTLIDGLQQLAQLDPFLIDSLQQTTNAIIEDHYQSWQDWWSYPTDRPNEVIYELIVYGVDARRWESLARQARRLRHLHTTEHTFASVIE
jgi:hypothetical protein